MKIHSLQQVIYVTIDGTGDEQSMLAWNSIRAADSGKVGVYKLVEVLEKRESIEVRRPDSKKWFKP